MISVDDVATGLLVNAISAAGRWLGTAAGAARTGRGRAGEDLAVARWFETYKLTERLPDLSGLSDKSAERLRKLLSGDDAQAAVQELLAVRLTDGSNEDASLARQAFSVTLSAANDTEISIYADGLADYYDNEIIELVGHLADTPLLAQVRSEALSARMIAVLHAIDRHTAALSARPAARTESGFLTRYLAHVLEHHGKLEPPDFERRHRVPIADIYVPAVIYEEKYPERMRLPPDAKPPSFRLRELADMLDRTVLLGDPGGGKTTASTVLMHHFAANAGRRIPFLVTLRNFAAEDPPARSVVGFIEHELETLYQCPAPAGLVDLLLLTGRGVVIFDGLDELLDTARRADVSTRVERFCTEYPLAPVLVTSRAVGYDQARLDESQFTCYRLGGLSDEDVAEYARKWFALDEGADHDDADAFMTESESVSDLRSNPLLLSLMCILYRGEGSLPRNRAEIYEQCANLLFRRWDARRRIHQDLRAGHLLEPALRHLAWWLFTRSDTLTAVTERELVAATAEFLYGRGFESLDDAHEAAQEFVQFSRGRMWVFSDQGTTASGERLYAFTHRTFLEYFAAARLAYDSDTPEKLAAKLAPRVARGEWSTVTELAIQIKDRTSSDGARRVYEYLLDERRRRSTTGRSNVLRFLARSLKSVNPSPPVTRRLATEVIDFLFSGDPDDSIHFTPMDNLMASCDSCLTVVNEEVTSAITRMLEADSPELNLNGLKLIIHLGVGPNLNPSDQVRDFWFRRRRELALENKKKVIAASGNTELIPAAFNFNLITMGQALALSDGLLAMATTQYAGIGRGAWYPRLVADARVLLYGSTYAQHIDDAIAELHATGIYLMENVSFPCVSRAIDPWGRYSQKDPLGENRPTSLEPATYFGTAVMFLMSVESDPVQPSPVLTNDALTLGIFSLLYPYIERRQEQREINPLPDLPVPEEFQQVFRDWAEGKVNFIGAAPDSPNADRQ